MNELKQLHLSNLLMMLVPCFSPFLPLAYPSLPIRTCDVTIHFAYYSFQHSVIKRNELLTSKWLDPPKADVHL